MKLTHILKCRSTFIQKYVYINIILKLFLAVLPELWHQMPLMVSQLIFVFPEEATRISAQNNI